MEINVSTVRLIINETEYLSLFIFNLFATLSGFLIQQKQISINSKQKLLILIHLSNSPFWFRLKLRVGEFLMISENAGGQRLKTEAGTDGRRLKLSSRLLTN